MLRYSYVPAESVLRSLSTGKRGLSSQQAAERTQKYGPNAIEKTSGSSPVTLFFSQFKDVMTLLLIAAAVVSAVVAFFSGDVNDLTDTVIIIAIIFLNAIVGTVQQFRADKAIESLKKLSTPYARVLRDGKTVKLPAAQLTVGDIVEVEEGDLVPADCRIVGSANLKVDESALTGEANAVSKRDGVIADKNTPLGNTYNMLFSSTFVVGGNATAVVTGIGRNTQIGAIADMLEGETAGKTPLERSLDKLGKIISLFVLAVAAVIFVVGACAHGDVLKSFMTAVAVAVAAIPEGLPAVVTIIMAMGVQRMSGRNVVIRKLKSVETLGGCTCICTDKTGTLTQNKMRVTQVLMPAGVESDKILACMSICNHVRDGVGDPTELALAQYAENKGYSAAYETTGEIPFSSERKMMSVAARVGGKTALYVKGAPDIVIKRCTRIVTERGSRAITQKDIEYVTEHNARMSDDALRVLAFAYRAGGELKEEELTFIGLCGMMDALKPGVKQAVEECRTAGVKTVMITGDHARTAYAIAKQAGICRGESDRDKVFSGEQLDAMPKAQRAEAIRRGKVFARVTPAHKNLIVKVKKNAGEVVAMTGDGVNDAPSIKEADIGIGMGITGTQVSKEAADMVLTDDNFATIVGAVEEGRKIFANITKAIQFLLSANIAEVLCLFIATVVIGEQFLTPVMILWVNLVTDSFPALALGTERAERDVMLQPPRKSDSSLFAGQLGKDIVIQGVLQTALVLTAYLIGDYVLPDGAANHNVPMTMAFVSLCFIQLFHAFNLRSQRNSVLNRRIFSNRYLDLSALVGIALTLTVVLVPALNTVFHTAQLSPTEWLVSVGVAVAVIPLVELQKVIEKFIRKAK